MHVSVLVILKGNGHFLDVIGHFLDVIGHLIKLLLTSVGRALNNMMK